MSAEVERFWAKVDQSGGPSACWEWLAYRTALGYGQAWFGRGMRRAHRVAWELTNGAVPDGLQLDHLCRNRGCVNPAHLEPVTSRENSMRGVGLAPANVARTHCPAGHPYSGNNLKLFRSSRRCRTCHRLDSNSHYRAQHPVVRRLLTEDQVRAIRSGAAAGASQAALAGRFGVSRSNVSMVVGRRTWRDVS